MGGRYYTNENVFIKDSILRALHIYNTKEPFTTIDYDEIFVGLLLTEIIGKTNLVTNNIDQKKLDFVKGQFNDVKIFENKLN